MESETELEQTVLMVLKVPFNLNSRVRKFEVRLGPPGGDKGYKVRLKIMIIVLVIITMITRAIRWLEDHDNCVGGDHYVVTRYTYNVSLTNMAVIMMLIIMMRTTNNTT